MIKVIAIGNRLMSDDGIALEVAERIGVDIESLGIEVVIGETDFEYCLKMINNNDFIIIIDSIFSGLELGTVTLTSMDNSDNFLSANSSQHDISLVHMLKAHKEGIRGFIIGIEVRNIEFGLKPTTELLSHLDRICEEVINKVIIILGGVKNA